MDSRHSSIKKRVPSGAYRAIQEAELPELPGVYQMLDQHGGMLYIGKAKNLKSRISYYLYKDNCSQRINQMLEQVSLVQYMVTQTDTEALLLEANLVKVHRPRYNILLKDDKSFPYIEITTQHDVPRLRVVRITGNNALLGKCFGPYPNRSAVYKTIDTIQRAFLLRTCTDEFFRSRKRPCLLYEIQRCSGPCTGLIEPTYYRQLVAEACETLSGQSTRFREHLMQNMLEASENMEFERASVYRDRIQALTVIQKHQTVISKGIKDADFIAMHEQCGTLCIELTMYRNYNNIGQKSYFVSNSLDSDLRETTASFILQYYASRPVPRYIYTAIVPTQQALIVTALSEQHGQKVHITTPRRGEPHLLMRRAQESVMTRLHHHWAKASSQKEVINQLKTFLNLSQTLQRIEVYDNSHLQGTNAVSVRIVVGPNGFEKKHYRIYTMGKSVQRTDDDFGMMKEVIERRFKHYPLPNTSEQCTTQKTVQEEALPDMILIDGGIAHVNAVHQVLQNKNLGDLTLIGIAKGPQRNAGKEVFYRIGFAPIIVQQGSPLLFFLQRIRDEAHRFAISAHRRKRKISLFKNPLDAIEGIGQARKRALMTHFVTLNEIKDASVSDLQQVNGISPKIAYAIYKYFH